MGASPTPMAFGEVYTSLQTGPKLEAAALEAARRQRARVEPEDRTSTERLAAQGMTIREIDRNGFLGAAETLWRNEATALDVGPWLQAALAR
jgi:TRAP-type C4-dicarboxylate transport system substrate-binding protein